MARSGSQSIVRHGTARRQKAFPDCALEEWRSEVANYVCRSGTGAMTGAPCVVERLSPANEVLARRFLNRVRMFDSCGALAFRRAPHL